MNNVMPAAEVAVQSLRDGKPLELTLTADRLPTNVLSDLPPAYAALVDAAPMPKRRREPELKLQDLKLAEFPQTCRVYVPPTLAAGRAGRRADLAARARRAADRRAVPRMAIDLRPRRADPGRTVRRRCQPLGSHRARVSPPIERTRARRLSRSIRRRVVVFGQEGGGAMAYLLALVSRDLFTGVATTAAALPRTVDPPSAQPTTRLAVFAGLPTDDESAARRRNLGLKKLCEAGYPVTAATIASPIGNLSAEEREQLSRWIDTLDRF